MISAGTIAAYLTLETSKFNRSISEVMQMLMNLAGSSDWGRIALEQLGITAGNTAGAFSGTLSGAVRQCGAGFSTAAQAMILAMSDASVKVNEKVSATKGSLLSIGDSAGAVQAKSQQVADGIKAPFQSLNTSAYSIMSNVGAGLNRGLADKKSTILATAKAIANSVVGTMRSVLKIASPSRVMRQIGEQTAQGLAIGIGAGTADVGRSADAMAHAITGRHYSRSSGAGGGEDISSLAGRLDQLISLLSGSAQVMQVDGRAFARLIREYS